MGRMLFLRGLGKILLDRNKTRLSRINPKTCAKDLWKAVRQLTGRRQNSETAAGITAQSLKQYYAGISTDTAYQPSQRKLTACHPDTEFVSEWQLFNILDNLPSTATGMDNLPAWFLRVGAPFFYKPLAYLCNKSLSVHHEFHASGRMLHKHSTGGQTGCSTGLTTGCVV